MFQSSINIPDFLRSPSIRKKLNSDKNKDRKVELLLNGQTVRSLKELRENFNADELMAEFDRESNTRRFTGEGKTVIKVLFLAFAAFALLTRFVTFEEQVRMSLLISRKLRDLTRMHS